MSNPNQRLDSVESVFFSRQLESIDTRAYEHKYPQYKARMFIAPQTGVDPDADVYTYRMYDGQGKARPIGRNPKDLPRANASGEEVKQAIVNVGAAYSYDLFEIRKAAKNNVPLDQMRGVAARR